MDASLSTNNNGELNDIEKRKILLRAQLVREKAKLLAKKLIIQNTNTNNNNNNNNNNKNNTNNNNTNTNTNTNNNNNNTNNNNNNNNNTSNDKCTTTEIVYKIPLLVDAERLALLESETPLKFKKDHKNHLTQSYLKRDSVIAKDKPQRKAAKIISSERFVSLLSPELQLCYDILTELRNHKYARPFNQPVDPITNPTYQSIISRPMDLGTIMDKLLRGEYFSHYELKQDVHLVWYNCRCFNEESEGNQLRNWADTLEKIFDSKFETLLEESIISKKRHRLQEKMKPLREELTTLKYELAKLKTDPKIPNGTKVHELQSEEPLEYGDVRRITKLVQNLEDDRETIAKVIGIIRKRCPKAIISSEDEFFELDFGLVEPRTARELEQICEKAFLRLKRKRSLNKMIQNKRRKKSSKRCLVRHSSPDPSDKSQSTDSSFCRENLSKLPDGSPSTSTSTYKPHTIVIPDAEIVGNFYSTMLTPSATPPVIMPAVPLLVTKLVNQTDNTPNIPDLDTTVVPLDMPKFDKL